MRLRNFATVAPGKRLLVLFSCLLITLIAAAGVKSAFSGGAEGPPPAVADTFSSSPSPNSWFTDGVVRAIDTADDGTTYIGGDFSHVWPRTGPGVPVDSTSGNAVETFPKLPTTGTVDAVVSDGSGGWYVGGAFEAIGGVALSNLAHISPDGAVDTDWAPQPDNRVHELLIEGGRLFAAGEFSSIGGQSRGYVAELDVSGLTTGEATAWDPEPDDVVLAMDISGDSLYVGGEFTTISGAGRGGLAQVDISALATGDVTAWAPTANGSVHALTVDGSTIYVGGGFSQISGLGRNGVAAVAGDGTGDVLSWDPDVNGLVSDFEISGDTVYLAGGFTDVGGSSRSNLAAVDSADLGVGTASDWNPSANNAVSDIEIGGDLLFAGGDFTTVAAAPRNHVAAVDLSGASTGDVTAWNPNAAGTVNALAINGSDIYLGGSFPGLGGYDRENLAALDVSGDAIPWNPGANSSVHALLVEGTTVYAGGDFMTVDGQARSRIAAIETTGAVLPWNPGADGTVLSLEESDGLVYAGGTFAFIGGQPRSRLAAIEKDLGIANDWDPDPNGTVRTMDLEGSLFVGGDFTLIGGTDRAYLAALDVTGATTGEATDFDMPANLPVHAIDIDNDIVYVAGEFTQIAGVIRVRLASIDPGESALLGTGGPGDLTTWNPIINGTVRALDVQGSKVYIGGDFTMVYASLFPRKRLAAIDKATSKPTVWTPDPDGPVLAISAGQTIVQVGGSFINSTVPIRGFARYEGTDVTPPGTGFTTQPSWPDGDNGWFTTTPDIILTRDEPGTTQYQWNGTTADAWLEYAGSLPATEGTNLFNYRSIDNAGNTEDAKSQLIKVDTAVPQDPTPDSSSHTIGVLSTNRNIVMEWPATGDGSAADNVSGVGGFSYEWSSEAETLPDSDIDISGSVTGVTSEPLAAGTWYFHLRTKDNAGNWTSTVHVGPYVIDGTAPVTTIAVSPTTPNGTNGWYKTVPRVTLTRSESGGATQYKWDSGTVVTSWPITVSFNAPAGKHVLYYRSLDSLGNVEGWKSRTIWVDAVVPKVVGPYVPDHSAKVSKRTNFVVTWGGSDPSGGSGLLSYDLLYKKGLGGSWQVYRWGLISGAANFTGLQGSTYYFKIRVRDKAGNLGYSAEKYTIIPADERAANFSAGWSSVWSPDSQRFMGTTRYIKKKWASMTYTFQGSNVSLIATRGVGRGKAWVYIDGYLIRTIDTGGSSTKHRELFPIGNTVATKTHTLKVVNQATSGRPMLEVDGIAVKK